MTVTLGNLTTLWTQITDAGGVPVDDPGLTLEVIKPDGLADTFTAGEVTRDGVGAYHLDYLPAEIGVYIWRWVGDFQAQGASEGTFDVTSIAVARVTDPADVRVLVPRVQRAVEGVVRANWTLSPDEVKDLVADAIADVVLYTGTVFGSKLIVTHIDPVTRAPDEYATSLALPPEQAAVIAAQAALTYFFHRFSGSKMSEKIADEASSWEYSLSPSLLAEQLRLLQKERDLAINSIPPPPGGFDEYVSFLAQRDNVTARLVEPWVYGHPEGYGIGAGGLEGDFRFDQLPSGGGDYSGVP